MSDTTLTKADAAKPAPLSREAALREASRLADLGALPQADALLRALYRPGVTDSVLMHAWGRLRRRAGDLKNAALMLEQAVRGPAGAGAMADFAAVLIDSGRLHDAATILRQTPTPTGAPRVAALEFERGRLQEASRQIATAAATYRTVMRTDPAHIESRLALARLLAQTGETTEAERAYRALLARHPTHAQALSDLGWLYGSLRRFHDSLRCYDRIEALGLDATNNLSMVALGLMHICDWSMRDALRDRLVTRFAASRPYVLEAYAVLAMTDDPATHSLMAARLADTMRARTAGMGRPAARGMGEGRLRIGLLCGDFYQHATSLLLAGVIEAFDRDRFELTAYDYSPEDNSPIRARMVAAFEHFVRLGNESQAQSAARIAADGIDILVDLKGYTERTRTDIMALRPAPVQVSFLGYAGTLGAEWIDYVLADATVLPFSQALHWAEKIVHLPGSYYPNDRTRPNPSPNRDRAAQGLPADGFVFACFNNPFKISPEIFAAWMEILKTVHDSVLWLYEGNEFMAANLRRTAEAAGVAPARLVFTQPASLEAHVARHGCIDLFLDTAPYGAHTTGADALWAGVPMLTCAGASFASRVGASLLHTLGLPELITESLEEYKTLAVSLAGDPDRLKTLRERLAVARDTASLFDAAAFARGLEDAFTTMAERHRSGATPEAFAVTTRMPK